MLPVSLESADVGEISTVARAYDYYPLYRGGANGKGIAQFNTVTPLVYRTYPISERFPAWQPERSTDLRPIAATYDYVLVWGWDPYATVLLRSGGFELIHEQGNLRLFENRTREPSQAASHE